MPLNFKIKIILLTLFVLFLIYIGLNHISIFGSEYVLIKVRPVKMQVLSQESGKPISGVKIDYILYAVEYKRIFGFQYPENRAATRIVFVQTKETDGNGFVNFAVRDIHLRKYEVLDNESIFVNIDNGFGYTHSTGNIFHLNSNELYSPNCREFKFNCMNTLPNYDNNYTRTYIYSGNNNDEKYNCGSPDWVNTTYQCMGNGLRKNAVTINVYLQQSNKGARVSHP